MIMIRRIVGLSMLPRFKPGRIVLGLKRRAKVGDAVIARRGPLEVIKRIQATGPQGYFLLGDNPAHSTDSRRWGWFAPHSIKAVVLERKPHD